MDNRTGKIAISGKKAEITFERRLPHPIEKVWAAITEPAKRAEWFSPTSIEPIKGGQMITTAEGPPAPEDVRRSARGICIGEPQDYRYSEVFK